MEKEISINSNHSQYIYISSPRSNTVALMIHGIVGTPRHFDEFLPLVPKDWSIYNLLLDGHGGTVSDFANTSMAKWKEQVNSVLCRLYTEYDNIVIVGHSMGTLLSLDICEKYADKISAMILLAIPLKMFPKPSVVSTSLKIAWNRIDMGDEHIVAARNSYSVEADKRLWRYLGWISRYFELFRLAHDVREKIQSVAVPCYIFQSRRDELVSMKSVNYIPNRQNFRLRILENSWHYHYSKEDYECLKAYVKEIFDDVEKNKSTSFVREE